MKDTFAILRMPSIHFPILAWELGARDSVFLDECVQCKEIFHMVRKKTFLRYKLRKRLTLLLKFFPYVKGKEESFLKKIL